MEPALAWRLCPSRLLTAAQPPGDSASCRANGKKDLTSESRARGRRRRALTPTRAPSRHWAKHRPATASPNPHIKLVEGNPNKEKATICAGSAFRNQARKRPALTCSHRGDSHPPLTGSQAVVSPPRAATGNLDFRVRQFLESPPLACQCLPSDVPTSLSAGSAVSAFWSTS